MVLTVTRPGRGCWNANYDLTMDREEGAPLIRLVTNVRKKKKYSLFSGGLLIEVLKRLAKT